MRVIARFGLDALRTQPARGERAGAAKEPRVGTGAPEMKQSGAIILSELLRDGRAVAAAIVFPTRSSDSARSSTSEPRVSPAFTHVGAEFRERASQEFYSDAAL